MGYLSTYAIVSKTAPGHRKLPVWERVYCWFLILLGVAGGLCATVNAVECSANTRSLEDCCAK